MLVFFLCVAAASLLPPTGEPKAPAWAQVVVGRARFTVLTDALVRLEYNNAEDRATMVVWNRALPRAPFVVEHEGQQATIATKSFVLKYRETGSGFTEESLQVQLLRPRLWSNATEWRPGMHPHGNLFGTFHTLDGINGSVSMNCTVDNAAGNSVGFGSEPLAHCSWGLVSRAGWALVDDSYSPVFPSGSGWPVAQTSGTCNASVQIPCFRDKQFNPTTRSQCEQAGCCFGGTSGCFKRSGNVDWYLFTHGIDYAGALRDFTAIAGATPMPRRHWLGFSWSRWGNNLTQETSYEQLKGLETAGFPLSTYVFDMNWHEKPHWTGWTWDDAQYPNHAQLLDYIHDKGLAIGANLHDAEGVMPFEKRFAEMAAANGFSGNQTVPFRISQQRYADTLSSIMLEPLAREGIDFWWTDYQQGETLGVPDITGSNPTMLLNHYRFYNYSGSAKRGLIHSRWGGLGGHRYFSGFGGDVRNNFASLNFMVYFTATAANVAFSWGHEMMIAVDDATPLAYEVFVRTMQFGALSPVFTSWGNKDEPNDLWNMAPEYLNATRDALVFRAQLLPYLYSAYKFSQQTGLIVTRPLYYSHPMHAAAYECPGQYMLGGDILVAPVTVPMQSGGKAPVTIWFPPIDRGRWFAVDSDSETYPADGAWRELWYPLSRTPAFVRSGAILALLPRAEAVPFGAAGRPAYAALELWSYPSQEATSSAWVFEDDGMSSSNDYANTTIQVTRDPAHALWRLSVRVASHGYTPAARPVSVKAVGMSLGSDAVVAIGGVAATMACPAVAPGTYCGSGSSVFMLGGPSGGEMDFLVKGAVLSK
jgi:alpha-glucosidase (family GH31 glycosyl hydrolase)